MTLELQIVVPDGVVLHQKVTGLQATDASGRFGLWPNHQAFITLLAPCVLAYRDENGSDRYAAADGGVLLLENNAITVVTREAATADRLDDIASAAAAMMEARRLHERTARTESAELQTVLLRELREVQKRS